MTIYVVPSYNKDEEKVPGVPELMVPADLSRLIDEINEYPTQKVFAVNNEVLDGDGLKRLLSDNKGLLAKSIGRYFDIHTNKWRDLENQTEDKSNILENGFSLQMKVGFAPASHVIRSINHLIDGNSDKKGRFEKLRESKNMQLTSRPMFACSYVVMDKCALDMDEDERDERALAAVDGMFLSPVQNLIRITKRNALPRAEQINMLTYVSATSDGEMTVRDIAGLDHAVFTSFAEYVQRIANMRDLTLGAGAYVLFGGPKSGKTYTLRQICDSIVRYKEPTYSYDENANVEDAVHMRYGAIIGFDSLREDLFGKGEGGAGVKGINNDVFKWLRIVNNHALLCNQVLMLVINPMTLGRGQELIEVIRACESACSGVLFPSAVYSGTFEKAAFAGRLNVWDDERKMLIERRFSNDAYDDVVALDVDSSKDGTAIPLLERYKFSDADTRIKLSHAFKTMGIDEESDEAKLLVDIFFVDTIGGKTMQGQSQDSYNNFMYKLYVNSGHNRAFLGHEEM